jgi:membrane protein
MDVDAKRPPRRPSELPRRAWRDVLKRTWRELRNDAVTLLASALTYYAVLTLLPALLILVSVLRLVGERSRARQPWRPRSGPARAILTGAIMNLQHAGGSAASSLVLALVAALWSASGYVGGFMKAANVIYGVEEGRPFWERRPLQIGVTELLALATAGLALAVVLTGPLARGLGELVGLGDSAVTV